MEMEAPGFWDNQEISNQKMKELKNLQDSVKAMHDLETQYEDIETLIEMGNEANDEEMAEEIREELDSFIGTLQSYGSTQTQIVFSTAVEPRDILLED